MTGQPILINPAGDAERRLWQTTNEITVLLESIRWVLIGGQMLTIIEREHGGGIGRAWPATAPRARSSATRLTRSTLPWKIAAC